jgi:hypothetical protein
VSGAVMRASDWRPYASGTLVGFFDLLLPSGLKLNDCTLHERDGKRWVGLPGKPQPSRQACPTIPATQRCDARGSPLHGRPSSKTS